MYGFKADNAIFISKKGLHKPKRSVRYMTMVDHGYSYLHKLKMHTESLAIHNKIYVLVDNYIVLDGLEGDTRIYCLRC